MDDYVRSSVHIARNEVRVVARERYADFADLVYFPPAADTPALFVLAYLNPGDSLGSAATPLAPIAGRDLMIRLDLDGELSD